MAIAMFKFRKSKGAVAAQFSHNTTAEIIWTVIPVLILVGFATRFSALALIGMTLTIQLFVYPQAYPTHGTWLAVLLLLVAKGPGRLSIDHLISRRYR